MDDLCHVVHKSGLDCVRLVAGIFLDVSFSPELRGELVKHKKYSKPHVSNILIIHES